MSITMPLHFCAGDLPPQGFGEAVWNCTECAECADGTLWIGNGVDHNQVRYCPYCGYEARVWPLPRVDHGASVPAEGPWLLHRKPDGPAMTPREAALVAEGLVGFGSLGSMRTRQPGDKTTVLADELADLLGRTVAAEIGADRTGASPTELAILVVARMLTPLADQERETVLHDLLRRHTVIGASHG